MCFNDTINMIKSNKKKLTISDFQKYWKTPTKHGHEFTFAYGKNFKDTKIFTVEVKHSDKIRSKDGRWSPIKIKS